MLEMTKNSIRFFLHDKNTVIFCSLLTLLKMKQGAALMSLPITAQLVTAEIRDLRLNLSASKCLLVDELVTQPESFSSL